MLYARGENNGRVLIIGTGWRAIAGIITREPNSPDVKDSTRYPPSEFGIQIGTQRTLAAWQAAKKRGDLKIEYLGEKKVKEVGDRTCWVLRRTFPEYVDYAARTPRLVPGLY